MSKIANSFYSEKDFPIASIVLPLRSNSKVQILDLLRRLQVLRVEAGVQVIVSDNSSREMQDFIRKFPFNGITYIFNNWDDLGGHNKKVLNIIEALKIAHGECIIFIDDDTHLTPKDIFEICRQLKNVDTTRTMVRFGDRGIMSSIDMCSIYIVNLLCRDKQFWGMQAFRREVLPTLLSVDTRTVFDELTMFRMAQEGGFSFEYLPSVQILSKTNRTWRMFLEQRLRYAYENIAYPIRFIIFSSILPSLVVGLIGYGETFFFSMVTLISMLSIFMSFLGYREYGNSDEFPWLSFAAAPLWVLGNSIFSWVALGLYAMSGATFSGNKIVKPA